MEYTREDLIEICKDAIVPFRKWSDRDSYSAQIGVQSVYQGLSVGLDYVYTVDDNGKTIWITFEIPTEEQIKKLKDFYLNIDSLDDYKEEFGYDSEMFDGCGIDWNSSYFGSYLPTRERLESANGDDWY